MMDLAKCGIINGVHNAVCPFRFFWKKRILSICFVLVLFPNRFGSIFACGWLFFCGICDGKASRFKLAFLFLIFGLTFCWSIWSCRNSILFKGSVLRNLVFWNWLRSLLGIGSMFLLRKRKTYLGWIDVPIPKLVRDSFFRLILTLAGCLVELVCWLFYSFSWL